MTQKAVSFDSAMVITVKRNDYRINLWIMTKKRAVDSINNYNHHVKGGQQ